MLQPSLKEYPPRDAGPADASSSSWRSHYRRQAPSPPTMPSGSSVSQSASTSTVTMTALAGAMPLPSQMPSAVSAPPLFETGVVSSSIDPSSSSSTSETMWSSISMSGTVSVTLSDIQSSSSLNTYSTYNASATPTSSLTSKSKSWTYTPSASSTTSGYGAAATTYVPGIIFNMSVSLPSDAEAVYSVPMAFGHDPSGGNNYRRAPAGSIQTLNMLVDLGSSDMWVASKDCKSQVCKAAPALFNPELSDDSGVPQQLEYHSGSVSGDIFWEQVTLGNFGIGYQAMVVGDEVSNENLGPGNFSGLLGLALPANSLITKSIPGTTGSAADGATFLDNLFGAGASAPTQRYFSLSLQRPQDMRTYSTFGIGDVFKTLCPDTKKLTYVPIVANPQFGRTGFLHWRVQVDAIHYTTFGEPKDGSGATSASIPLGRSETSANTTTPLAVLDSGGLPILVGNKTLIDSIYGAFGIQASSDGIYRMPCTTQMALALTIGGTKYPIHPLDLTWPDKDPGSSNCVGGLQYTPSIKDTGDLILGSAFLKNVYSVYQYPDQSKSPSTWQPTVGMLSLTDPAAASRDFFAVRNQRQSLQVVSSGGLDGSNSNGGGSQQAAQHKAVNVAVIAACSVVGFVVLVAVVFCVWWFRLRRRLGAQGQVDYKMTKFDPDTSTDTFRSRKHLETKRQRSMVDGYSDYEVDSWRSGRTAESLGLAGVPEVHDEDDPKSNSNWDANALPNHSRGQSLHQGLLSEVESPQSIHSLLPDSPIAPAPAPPARGRTPDQWPQHRGSIAPELSRDRRASRASRSSKGSRSSIGVLVDDTTPLPHPLPLPLPHPSTSPERAMRPKSTRNASQSPERTLNPTLNPAHSPTLSMSGPFPAVSGSTTPSAMPHGHGRADEYDYFPVQRPV